MHRFWKGKAAWEWVKEQLASDSLDAKIAQVQAAWAEQYGASYDAGWVCDVYDDRVIVRNPDGGFQAYPYTMAGDGTITFQAPVDVEVVYNEISEAIELDAVTPRGKSGTIWEVRVLKFGRSRNGFLWSREAGEKLAPLLVSAPVGCFMDPAGAMGHADERSVAVGNGPLIRNIVGDLQTPRVETDGVYASLHVHEDAGWLKQKLLGLANRGVVDKVLGLSVDTLAGYVPVQLREGAAKAITEIKRLFSVDIVTRPSADGRFIRATAGPLLTEGDQVMNRAQLIAMIQEHRPKLLEGRVVESLTDDQLAALVKEALREPEKPKPEPDRELDVKLKKLTALEQRLAIRESQERVAEAVDATELPDPVKAKLKKSFAGKVAEQAEIDLVVKDEIETWGKLAESGKVMGLGTSKIEITAAPRDKIQAGLDMLFGVTRESLAKKLETSPLSPEAQTRIMENYKATDGAAKDPGLRFRGIKDAYVQMTGDTDVSGYIPAHRVKEAATVVLSTDWAEALGNTLYRRLLSTYAEVQYNERSIARYSSARDFREKNIVHLGYFGDLAAVAENGAYDGITNPTDDQVKYAVTKRGNLFAVTLENIKNDDIRAVMETVDRFGRSARRTLARFVWSFWGAAGTGGHVGLVFDIDSKAWFDSTDGRGVHCNYGTTALTADATGADEVLAMITRLGDMKEKDSLEKLGLPRLTDLWLDVPIALWGKATKLNRTAQFSTTADNPVYQLFGANNERINTNPLFADLTDWGIHIDPNSGGRESVEISFLDGREEPELFVQDLPTQGSLFTNDRITWKIRHIYGGDIADVVGAAKNIVTG